MAGGGRRTPHPSSAGEGAMTTSSGARTAWEEAVGLTGECIGDMGGEALRTDKLAELFVGNLGLSQAVKRNVDDPVREDLKARFGDVIRAGDGDPESPFSDVVAWLTSMFDRIDDTLFAVPTSRRKSRNPVRRMSHSGRSRSPSPIQEEEEDGACVAQTQEEGACALARVLSVFVILCRVTGGVTANVSRTVAPPPARAPSLCRMSSVSSFTPRD